MDNDKGSRSFLFFLFPIGLSLLNGFSSPLLRVLFYCIPDIHLIQATYSPNISHGFLHFWYHPRVAGGKHNPIERADHRALQRTQPHLGQEEGSEGACAAASVPVPGERRPSGGQDPTVVRAFGRPTSQRRQRTAGWCGTVGFRVMFQL